jgi:hypothetical protein
MNSTAAILTSVLLATLGVEAKPLKVFILAGQSNMESHARIETFDYFKKYEAELISPAEAAKWKRGASNAGYHYLGCAKTFALMGKAFADANLAVMKGRNGS